MSDTNCVERQHEAMATTFTFRVRHAEVGYARQALQAAFAEVDRIERLLSRFREGSDIWRINHARRGEMVSLSEECHACLVLAAELWRRTAGAFDVTVGGVVDAIRAEQGRLIGDEQVARRLGERVAVELDPVQPRVAVVADGATLDLGAIGKGFALDRALELLREWGVEHGLLNAGGSSILAFGSGAEGAAGWPVALRGERASCEWELAQRALGASGTSEQGAHVVDPRRGSQRYQHRRAWALASTAAMADALSTAWMTMTIDEIAAALTDGAAEREAVVEDFAGNLCRVTREGVTPLAAR